MHPLPDKHIDSTHYASVNLKPYLFRVALKYDN